MTGRGLDGAVPPDAAASHDAALAALTRRVAELEHRLNVMKVIVGLVLTGKVLFILFILYMVFGIGHAMRSGSPVRSIALVEVLH